MAFELLNIVKVIDVVNINLILLTNLEVVLHVKLLYPLRVEVVHDHLSEPNFLPGLARLLEEDCHSVSAREGIQVRKVFALD